MTPHVAGVALVAGPRVADVEQADLHGTSVTLTTGETRSFGISAGQ